MERGDFDRFQRQVSEIPISAVRNIVLSLVVVALLLVAAFTSVYQVEAQESGVVLRFGAFLKISEPGLHWKLPFFIDRVEIQETALVKEERFGTPDRGQTEMQRLQVAQMLTGDLNIADVRWTVQYRVENPYHFLYRVAKAEETLRDASESAMRLTIGDYSITDVLTEKREEIEIEVKRAVQDVLNSYETGIQIVQVNVQNVIPPAGVRPAFDAVTTARQKKDTTINQARQEYFAVMPEKRGEAQRMKAVAEGYKVKRINEALGNVAKFQALLTEYQRAPEVTRTRLYLESLGDVLPDVSQLYIVDDNQGGPLQVLDLQKAAAARRTASSRGPTGRVERAERPNAERRNR